MRVKIFHLVVLLYGFARSSYMLELCLAAPEGKIHFIWRIREGTE